MGVFYGEFEPPYAWAVMYRRLGLQVIPGRPGDKRPIGEWVEFQNVMVPPAQFERWYGPTGQFRMQTAIGLLTGACSRCGVDPETTSGLFLLDLDRKPAADGLEWWRSFVETHLNGIEPETWRAKSGGGGLHLFFLWPAGSVPPTFKNPALSVDGRGQGGYAVIAPTIHPNGKAYEWLEGYEPWNGDPPCMAPPELVEAILAMTGPGSGAAGGERAPPPGGAKNDFGRDTDGREDKMLRAVWGAVVDLYRDCPILPPEAVQEAELLRVWSNYEQTTKSRLEPRPGVTNGELLDLESPQRGLAELRRKWAYAIAGWSTKVAEAASRPKPRAEGDETGSKHSHTDSTQGAAGSAEQPDYVSRAHDVGDFHGDPPERRWLVRDWIAAGEVNSLYGGGAVGKSLLAWLLAHCAALGLPWLGLETVAGPSLYVSCEDGGDELHRRHAGIKAGLGYPIGNPFAGHVRWLDRKAGHDNRLAVLDQRGGLQDGPFLGELRAEILAVRPSLLVLDTLADVFGGEEINRTHVNMFVKGTLAGLIALAAANAFGLTVLLLGHPSKSAIADGSGFSGSTAWDAAVRSRLYLERPKEGSPDERILTRGKANYAAGEDDTLRLVHDGQVFQRFGGSSPGLRQLVQVVVNAVDWAWRTGSPYTSKRGHTRYIFGALVTLLTTDLQPREAVIEAIREAIEDQAIIQSKDLAKRGWRVPAKPGQGHE